MAVALSRRPRPRTEDLEPGCFLTDGVRLMEVAKKTSTGVLLRDSYTPELPLESFSDSGVRRRFWAVRI